MRRFECGYEARASARTDGSKTGRARSPAECGQSGTPRHSGSVRIRHPSRWICVIAGWYSSESPSRRLWRHVDTASLARFKGAVIHTSVELQSVERTGLGASTPRVAYVALHHLLESHGAQVRQRAKRGTLAHHWKRGHGIGLNIGAGR